MPSDPAESGTADPGEPASDRAFALVGDLVDRDRRSDRPALRVDALGRTDSYREMCETAAKAGNVLSHLGVRAGDRVAVSDRPLPQPLLTFLGAALLGAVTEFGVEPAADPDTEVGARAVVVPAEREGEFDLPGGSKLLAFGGEPDRPDTTRWETAVWSENPAFPPTAHDPSEPVLRGRDATIDAGAGADDGRRTLSHADLLDAASAAVDALGLDSDSRVAVRAPLADPRTVAAGVLAPLVAGGTVVLPDGDAPADETAAVVAEAADAPGDAGRAERTLALADVEL